LDVPYAIRLWRCLWNGQHPIAIEAARRSWRPGSWLLRVPLALWWLGHFLFGVVFVLLLDLNAGAASGSSSQLPGDDAALDVAQFVMGLALAYVANGFLVLALTTAGWDDRWLRKAWRYRLLVDFSLALAAVWIGRAYPG